MVQGLSRSSSRLCAALCIVFLAACAHTPPVVTASVPAAGRTPVVLVPGTTGVELVDRETGRVAWGRGKQLFFPRDGGYRGALSIRLPDGADDGLVPGEVIRKIRVGPIVRQIYGPVVRLMEANGYRSGRLESPAPDETFFMLSYDWRRDSLESVRQLADSLERLRLARGGATLHVDLICQSNAAFICRYYVKYGTASLAEAESGVRRMDHVRVERVVLVGAAEAGAMQLLRDMNQGRSYVHLVGRRFRPEAFFTIRSLFEGLPVIPESRFFDRDGQPVDADPFNASDWVRYGWSVFNPKVAKRLARGGHEDLFGTEEERLAYLEHNLDRARRLQKVLKADPPGFEPPRIYLVQDGYRFTPQRAMLQPDGDGWRTVFYDERPVSSDPYLRDLARSPGDGHSTNESQLWLSPAELAALGAPPVYASGRHFNVILKPGAQRRMLEFLLRD